jgi:hypothetical protein
MALLYASKRRFGGRLEKVQMEEKDFDSWVKARWLLKPLYIRGHKFEKNSDGTIRIDNGVFISEEAESIAQLLNSRNPFDRFSAKIAIWERNGNLRTYVLVGAIVLLILVIIAVRR